MLFFYNGDYLEILLDNENLFNSLFEMKSYKLELGNIGKRKKQVEFITYYSINPIINNCLRYSLQHLEQYKHRALHILKFAIEYDKNMLSKVNIGECYICNELGGLKTINDKDYYNFVIFVDEEVKDCDIKSLIEQLPKFRKY